MDLNILLIVTLGVVWGSFLTTIIWRVDACLLYTSDAADDLLCVDLGGRRIIKKKNMQE